ncbi:MAG: TetR/AcrR family transcriptional regulator [Acidimicrobiia bacterium]
MALSVAAHECTSTTDVHAGERERLLAAAWRLLERTGFENVKVQSVARSAGLSIRAFYRHFASKDELLAALLEEEVTRGADVMRSMMTGSPEQQVRTFVCGIISLRFGRHAGPRAKLFSLLGAQLEHRGQPTLAQDPLLEVLVDAVGAGVVSGDFPNADPRRDATFVLALCARLNECYHHELAVDRESATRDVADFAIRALRA